MIVADLIRVGRPLLAGGLDARTLLAWLSDVESTTAKNFYQHIFVVELSSDKGRPFASCSYQRWGSGIDKEFVPDTRRGLGAPFSLPVGGNPLNAQGYYGIPSYPCYDKQGFTKFISCSFVNVYKTQKTPVS